MGPCCYLQCAAGELRLRETKSRTQGSLDQALNPSVLSPSLVLEQLARPSHGRSLSIRNSFPSERCWCRTASPGTCWKPQRLGILGGHSSIGRVLDQSCDLPPLDPVSQQKRVGGAPFHRDVQKGRVLGAQSHGLGNLIGLFCPSGL